MEGQGIRFAERIEGFNRELRHVLAEGETTMLGKAARVLVDDLFLCWTFPSLRVSR